MARPLGGPRSSGLSSTAGRIAASLASRNRLFKHYYLLLLRTHSAHSVTLIYSCAHHRETLPDLFVPCSALVSRYGEEILGQFS